MRRRQFIQLGMLAGVPLAGPQLVFGRDTGKGSATRDILIVVFQRGAADGLNLLVPYNEGRYYDLRPTIAIAPPGQNNGALDLDGEFGLHPSLASLKPLYDQGDLGFVHAVGSPDDSRSHFDAQDFMDKGSLNKNAVFDGWLNRYLTQVSGDSGETFSAVGFGNALPLSLQGATPSVGVRELSDYALAAPAEQLPALRESIVDLFNRGDVMDVVSQNVLASVDLLAAADPLSIPVDGGAVYPDTQFGRQMSQLAQLIKADLGLEMAAVDVGDWDHHDQERDALEPLALDYANALTAFHTDLGSRMDQITVVTMTEFGRRVAENASAGTDHGHGSIMLAMGGGVNGGQVIRDWPGLREQDLYRGDLQVTTDWRTVLSEALLARTDVASLEPIFPEFVGPTEVGLFQPR
ncbi:MAG: DUF1501 domain-containing protein [Pseudomonadota bacterium]